MDSIGSLLSPRDAESGGSSSLTTGAIAGIACGTGALFLGAAGLFLIYWRRQRQFDREDNSDGESFDERGPPHPMGPALTYTMDYKMDNPHHHEGDQDSSYTYSTTEKPSSYLSPMSVPDSASAMPTHPAYIPRALVRGSTTPSNRSTKTTSPPPFPSPPFSTSGSSSKTQPNDTVIQAYLAAVAAGQPPTTTHDNPNLTGESDISISGLPIHTQQIPTQVPPLIMPPNSASSTDASSNQPQAGRKPRAYLPPRLNLSEGTAPKSRGGDKPLHGKENTTISGPLAFPAHYQAPPGSIPGPGASISTHGSKSNSKKLGWTREPDPEDDLFGYGSTSGDGWGGDPSPRGRGAHSHFQPQTRQPESRRTFRSRALTGGEEKEGKGKKHGRKKSDRNSGSGGNRHYTEIEIGRGSDIW